MTEPPDLSNIRHIDFSDFHPLDHSIADPYCKTLRGGRRLHWTYWWEFKGWGWIRCRYLRWHTYIEWTEWKVPGDKSAGYDTRVACRTCLKPKEGQP